MTDNEELLEFLAEQGYRHATDIEGYGVCALRPFIFTWGLCTNLGWDGFGSRFCYENYHDAAASLAEWDGAGKPPGPWIKEK